MAHSARAGLRPMTRLLVILLCLSPLALAVPALIQNDDEQDELDVGAPPMPLLALSPRLPGRRITVEELRPITGFAINAHHISDQAQYLDSVDRVAELGANALIVLTPMMQPYVDSNGMEFSPGKCATDDQLVAIFERAREKGLHTTLLPIVLLEHPGEKDWRGVIRPDDWDQWWLAYDRFIDRFINVANRAEVDLLIIGSELNSTEEMTERWTKIAKRVREEFKGQIGYSANWDRFDKITLWPLVDVMCVSSYFELEPDDTDASVAKLVRAWNTERTKLIKAAEKWKKPLVLSEVGYPSVPWASAHPWNYVVKAGAEADHLAQARAWRAFFRAWTSVFRDFESPAHGFFAYHWTPYYKGDAWDCSYGILNKPAYEIVKQGFARIRAQEPPATTQSD
jgi:hypothetical protein